MKFKKYPNILFTSILLFTSCLMNCIQRHEKKDYTDLIIFSFDRPLQLYALLESIDTYVTGLDTTTIIYRTSSSDYTTGYTEVQKTFPHARFIQQSNTPKSDFKQLTVQAFDNTPNDYILFAVDDIIITDFIDVQECVTALKKTNAYGFYLRLGRNITQNYHTSRPLKQPELYHIGSHMYTWNFTLHSFDDWQYPNTVDLTVYKKSDISENIHTLSYYAPNPLEGNWSARALQVKNRIGLCYEHSKMINIPVNRVQNDYKNKHMNAATPQQLLDIFNKNLKIDISTVHQINNNSAHMDYTLSYMPR